MPDRTDHHEISTARTGLAPVGRFLFAVCGLGRGLRTGQILGAFGKLISVDAPSDDALELRRN